METSNNDQILTTSIEENISSTSKKIILGDWCFEDFKKHEEATTNKKNFFLPRHINSIEDLSKDYFYIQKLLDSYSLGLTKYLNEFHKTKYTQRFWNILILPWLSCYIPTHFYRWKLISRLVKEKKSFLFSDLGKNKEMTPNTSLEYLKQISNSDIFNYYIFKKILIFFKKKNKNIIFIESKNNKNKNIRKKKYF